MVHRLGRSEDGLLPSLGNGVTLGKDEVVVVQAEGVHPQPLPDFCAQFGDQGDDIPADILPELLDLLWAVAQAAHSVIPQLHEILIAHLLGHAVPDVHQLVKQAIQLVAVGLEGSAQNLIGLLSRGPVRGLGVFHQHGAGQLLPSELELHPRHQLGVLADHPVLLHHILDDFRGNGFQLYLEGTEHQGDDRPTLLQFLSERGRQHGLGVLQKVVLCLGPHLIIVVLLRQVKGIGRVDAVAHIGQSFGSLPTDHQLVALVPGCHNRLGRGCFLHLGDNPLDLLGKRLHGDTLIGQLRYFLHNFSFPRFR